MPNHAGRVLKILRQVSRGPNRLIPYPKFSLRGHPYSMPLRDRTVR